MPTDVGGWFPAQFGLWLKANDIIAQEEFDEVLSLKRDTYDAPGAILLREILEKKGYDGIVYPNKVEGDGYSYAVFRDDQIIGREIQYVQRGIDYSLKGDDYNTRKLERENAELKELVEYWKSQTKRTERATTDKKAVRAAARELIRTYGADLEELDVAGGGGRSLFPQVIPEVFLGEFHPIHLERAVPKIL